jgi:DNA-binding NarL/FixJ family response regulator
MQILLADNQPKVRLGLRVLLERQPGFKVVGEASNAEELLARMEADRPDLVLLGWELPGLAGVDPSASRRGESGACTEPSRSEPSGQGLLSALRRVSPNLCVIALSVRSEARRAALAAGADAFVYKCDSPERLLAAIADCLAQETQQVSSNPLIGTKTGTDMKEVERCWSVVPH